MNSLIDTNVLVAASAHRALEVRDVTPTDPHQREHIHDWLDGFSRSEECWVLDAQDHIEDEYLRNDFTGQDFGMLALLHKRTLDRVLLVDVAYEGFDRRNSVAILPPRVAHVPWDESDKKFVAAAISVVEMGEPAQIVNTADSDWAAVREALGVEGIKVLELLEDFSRSEGV